MIRATLSNIKPTHEEIAERARALYEKSGRVPGRDLENWLQAEEQLLAVRKESSPRESTSRLQTRNGRRR